MRTTARGPREPETRRLLVALCIASGVAAGMPTLVMPLLPSLPEAIHSSIDSTSWVATSALLSGAVATGMIGRVGDRFGKRRTMIVSLVLALVGSIVGALSSSLIPLLVARTLQGTAIGVSSLALGVVRDALPHPRATTSSTYVGVATVGAGIGLTPLVMAIVLDVSIWRTVFWTSAGLTALSLVLLTITPIDDSSRTRRSFDWLGALGISIILICLLLPLGRAGSWGWTSRSTVTLLVATPVLAALWIIWESRHPAPMVDVPHFRCRQLLITHVASAAIGFAVWGQLTLTYAIVQLPASTGHGLGHSFTAGGLIQLPGIAVLAMGAPMGARALQRYRPPHVLAASCMLITAGFSGALLAHASALELILWSMAVMAGIGLAFATIPAVLDAHLPPDETARANALATLSRTIGSSTAAAVSGTVLASSTVTVGGIAYPSNTAFSVLYALCAAVAGAGTVAAISTGRMPALLASTP